MSTPALKRSSAGPGDRASRWLALGQGGRDWHGPQSAELSDAAARFTHTLVRGDEAALRGQAIESNTASDVPPASGVCRPARRVTPYTEDGRGFPSADVRLLARLGGFDIWRPPWQSAAGGGLGPPSGSPASATAPACFARSGRLARPRRWHRRCHGSPRYLTSRPRRSWD